MYYKQYYKSLIIHIQEISTNHKKLEDIEYNVKLLTNTLANLLKPKVVEKLAQLNIPRDIKSNETYTSFIKPTQDLPAMIYGMELRDLTSKELLELYLQLMKKK